MIHLTDSAIKKVKELIEQEDSDLFLRVAVRAGGCSGFSYEMLFDTPSPDDWQGEYDGVSVAVDPQSAPHLIDATLDYKEGLSGAGFVWDNPNVSRSCGCGQSFS